MQADVIVNITTSASSLSGLISKKVCDTARSHAFDLGNEYKKEVKKIQAVDGAIVQTSAGQLPCNVVYHLKIETNWPAYNGPAVGKSKPLNLRSENCMYEAFTTFTLVMLNKFRCHAHF